MSDIHLNREDCEELVAAIKEFLAADPIDDQGYLTMMDNLDTIHEIVEDILDRFNGQ